MIRQGDVLVIKVKELPEGATKLDTKVLQDSETMGKFHRFHPEADVEVYQTRQEPSEELTITPDFGKFVVVNSPSLLYHGKGFHEQPSTKHDVDHKALLIEPGVYKINIKREYDYTTKSHKRVVD